MKRVVAGCAILAAALLVQLTIVNGMRVPGGGAPDIVLLCVVALGMTGGARWGVTAGFCAGLALDLAPPADQLVGQYALVFCLAGYAAGRLRPALRYSALAALAAAGAVAVAAELLAAALTLALDTPEVTGSTVVSLLPSAVIYDLVLMPVFLFVVVRVAVALRANLDPLEGSPGLETGGSAAPATVTGANWSGVRVRPRQAGQRLVVAGDRRAAASGRWLVGDVAEAAPAVGAVGWLGGPVRTRRARKEQARLNAMLTGANPRRGALWVGTRPADRVPVAPPPPGPTGLDRLRPGAGVAGSASAVARPGPVAQGRPVRLGLAGEQRRRSRQAARSRREIRGTGLGTGGLDHGIDRHGVGGPGLPSIAFGTGSLPASARSARRKVPSIAFGSTRRASGGQAARTKVPSIAFGSTSRASAGKAARTKVPTIPFGSLSQPGWGLSTRRRVPAIAFGTGGLPAAGRSAGRGVPSISFGAPSRAAGHAGRHSVGARRPKQPHFTRVSAHQPVRARQAKTARFSAGRRRYRLLPWLHRAGGRSTVWRIGSARMTSPPMARSGAGGGHR